MAAKQEDMKKVVLLHPGHKQYVLKPLTLARVRCQAGHEDPWLRRLYILWAPVRSEDGRRSGLFHLGQTDQNGYLSAPGSELDPHPEGVQPLVADVDYLLFLVRHPGAD